MKEPEDYDDSFEEECISYFNGYCLLTGFPDGMVEHGKCESIMSCGFRQLKTQLSAKEEEIERLKAENEDWKSKYYQSTTEVKADLINEIERLKAENEELKKVLTEIKQLGCDNGLCNWSCSNCSVLIAKQTLARLESEKWI